jgi:hypothetical protein
MPNIRLKRYTGATWEDIEVQTDWSQILNKPSTFTPTSHTHGNIDNGGAITNTPSTISSGDAIMVSAATGNILRKTNLQFNSSGTSNYLRQDGTWATISGGGNVSTSGTITTNTIPFWASSTAIGSLATTTYPSLTELSRVKGVTSAIQTQLNGKAPTSHATSLTTYGVGTDVNYGHTRGGKLNTTADGEGGVSIISGTARATKTLRVNSIAQRTWGVLLNLTTTIGANNLVRFVDLTISRVEGGITYYIGSIMVDTASLVASSSTSPTLSTTNRWRLNSRNSSNAQLTLPIFMYRHTTTSTLRVYVDNATSATYHYECVGYF